MQRFVYHTKASQYMPKLRKANKRMLSPCGLGRLTLRFSRPKCGRMPIESMKILLSIILLLPNFVFACSFAQTMNIFSHGDARLIIPEKPNFAVSSIYRGTKGPHGGCQDAGSIKLQSGAKAGKKVGYRFSIERGQFEDALFINEPVVLVEAEWRTPGEYSFIWFDGNTVEQEPIDITVKIVAISEDGGESEPQFLRITHPGVKKPWWRFW